MLCSFILANFTPQTTVKMKYPQYIAKKGKWCKWVQPIRKGYKMACCTCGLVHDMEFRLYRGSIQFRARANNRATGQLRRWSNITIEH